MPTGWEPTGPGFEREPTPEKWEIPRQNPIVLLDVVVGEWQANTRQWRFRLANREGIERYGQTCGEALLKFCETYDKEIREAIIANSRLTL